MFFRLSGLILKSFLDDVSKNLIFCPKTQFFRDALYFVFCIGYFVFCILLLENVDASGKKVASCHHPVPLTVGLVIIIIIVIVIIIAIVIITIFIIKISSYIKYYLKTFTFITISTISSSVGF